MAKFTSNGPVIEIEDFISKVQAKSCLWDQKYPNYFKRDYQRVAWMEIADETHAPVNELKKKWRGLRDTFCRELKKLDPSLSDDELVAQSHWRLFGSLIFLRQVVTSSKKPSKRLPSEILAIQKDSDDDLDSVDDDKTKVFDRCPSPGSGHQDPLITDIIVKQEPRTVVTCDREQEDCVKESQLKSALDNDMDSDAQFLMSLLPFLQDVPKKRKLLVRARLTQVLMEEQDVQHYH